MYRESAMPHSYFRQPADKKGEFYVHCEVVDRPGRSSNGLKKVTLNMRVYVNQAQVAKKFELDAGETSRVSMGADFGKIIQILLRISKPEYLQCLKADGCKYDKSKVKEVNGIVPFLKYLEDDGKKNLEAPSPPGLTVTLRPYQRQSLRFMLDQEQSTGMARLLWQGPMNFAGMEKKLYYSQFLHAFSENAIPPHAPRGGFLCEEMGLGKTVEVLGLILANPAPVPMPRIKGVEYTTCDGAVTVQSRGTLVICPVSLVGQWAAEAKSKVKDEALSIYQYHGSSRKKDPKFLADHDVVVTTYATLGTDFGSSAFRPHKSASPLHEIHWHRIVLDESHNVKNSKSQHSKACCALKSLNRWCATGTPVGTTVQDLQGQLQFLHFHPLCNPSVFKRMFETPLTSSDHSGHNKAIFSVLKNLTIRHTKSQKIGGQTVLTLPPRTDVDIKIVLTEPERELYQQQENQARAYFHPIQVRGDRAVGKATIALLSALLPLRQLCAGGNMSRLTSAPIIPQANGTGDHAVMKRTQSSPGSDLECVICHDVLDHPVMTPCGHWFCCECITTWLESDAGRRGCPYCRGTFKKEDLAEPEAPLQLALLPADAEAQAAKDEEAAKPPMVLSKLKALVEDLRQIQLRDPSVKCLIFSQFTTSIDWLKEGLTTAGFGYRTITGSMPQKQRAKAIDAFQSDPPTTVFLLSMRSGAVGINLTAANVVYMLEPCLDPSLEEQAIGRVHRMGQTRPVTVKRLLVADSVEERVVKVVKDRCRSTAGQASTNSMGSGNAGALKTDRQKLKTEEWTYLFQA